MDAAAQYHERGPDQVSLAQEKLQIQSTVSTERVSLSHRLKVEKS